MCRSGTAPPSKTSLPLIWKIGLHSFALYTRSARTYSNNTYCRQTFAIRRISNVKSFLHTLGIATTVAIAAGLWLRAQDQDQTTFHVKVDMVVLSFSVTDSHGKYVNGLKPKDFKVFEDEIPEKVATFTEGNHAPLQVLDSGETKPLHVASASNESGVGPAQDLRQDAAGTNVFVLFDTSNYMYRGFVYASD